MKNLIRSFAMCICTMTLIGQNITASGQNNDSLIKVLRDSISHITASFGNELNRISKNYQSDTSKFAEEYKKFDAEKHSFDEEREKNKADLEKEITHRKLIQDSVHLLSLEKKKSEAQLNSDQNVVSSLTVEIDSAIKKIGRSKKDADNANAKAFATGLKLKSEERKNDSIIKADVAIHEKMKLQFREDTIRLRAQIDSTDSVRSKLDVIQKQLARNHSDQIIYSSLLVMSSFIAIYTFIFFFFRTRKILKEAKSIHKNESEAILRDTLIRYHYYNKAIDFTQSLLYISIAMSVVYAIILFGILVNTSDFGAGLKVLLDKESLSTLGVLATPLVFSITLYNFTEAKIQDNARLISELRKANEV